MSLPTILAISGSTKSISTSSLLLNYIKEYYSDRVDVLIYNGLASLPHFNPDMEKGGLPEEVTTLRELVDKADGVLFCTPEYVFSLPGSLKNAIEWCVSTTVFSGKPVATIVAAASGQKAFESLNLILTTIECQLPETSRLLINGAKGKVSVDGTITDPQVVVGIDGIIHSLLETISSEDAIPTKYTL